ncbi:MAG: alkaline phosphatase family protein [Rhodospirillales bacterium]
MSEKSKFTPKFMIVTFDGLRRDMVTPALAPNLVKFIGEGTDFPLSRSVFPSATRVNAAAMAAGASPVNTGVIANKFFDQRIFPDRSVHTGKYDHYMAAQKAYGGRFVDMKTLGEHAAEAGLSVAVVSTGSGGTTSLLNPKAEELGHVTLALTDWNASVPKSVADTVMERFGPLPPAGKPNIARIKLQTDMLLEYVLPDLDPDITFVWFSDPDSTYHQCGLGSPESKAAIQNADAQFGRILAWIGGLPEAERYQVFVMSDHGQITAKTRIKFRESMAETGLKFAAHFGDGADYAGSAGYYGAIRVRDGDSRRMASLIDWFADQPWRGLLFTPNGNGIDGGVPGTLDRSLLQVSHARAPEVYYTLRTDDSINQWGMPGACYFNSSELPEGGGTHGGLHPIELNNLLAVRGSAFRHAYASTWPASHTDIAPTILAMLGIDLPAEMTGRVLGEALERGGAEPPETETFECASTLGGQNQCLRYWRVARTVYLDHGWME